MITFIKNYDLSSIKKKFILLYLLNVTDIIFTLLLLRTGYFQEVNIFMIKAVQSPTLSLVLKILLPAAILLYLYYRTKSSDDSQLKVSNIALNISLTIYIVVNITHVIWVALLPFFILTL